MYRDKIQFIYFYIEILRKDYSSYTDLDLWGIYFQAVPINYIKTPH